MNNIIPRQTLRIYLAQLNINHPTMSISNTNKNIRHKNKISLIKILLIQSVKYIVNLDKEID